MFDPTTVCIFQKIHKFGNWSKKVMISLVLLHVLYTDEFDIFIGYFDLIY